MLYSAFLRQIARPMVEAVMGSRVLKHLTELEKTQWWSPAELTELQNEKLRSLVKHVYKNVPYYRKVFDERRLTPKDIKTVDDLSKLPILTKTDVRRNYKELHSADFAKRRVKAGATGGSTGVSLQYYFDQDAWDIDWACHYRGWGHAGYKYGDKLALLFGYSLVPDQPMSLSKRLRFQLERSLPLSAVHLSDEVMEEYVEILTKYCPSFIRGYASALFVFASYLNRKGITSIRPRAVFSTSEMLLPHFRQTIEEAFACEVFDGYGCRDGGANAMECAEHTGLHISVERMIMEFLMDGENVSPGQIGEITLTDLHNYAMPFIRYQPEDAGRLAEEPCPCGRGLPLMEPPQGRTSDIMTFGNGITLSAPAMTVAFSRTRFENFQLVQDGEYSLAVKLVKGPDPVDNDVQHVLNILHGHLGSEIKIRVEFVADIPASESGKRQYFVTLKPHRS